MLARATFAMTALLTMTALTSTAHAYIDPGTGSMLLQMLGAAVAGAFFYFRHWRRQISHWFRNRKTPADSAAPPEKSP